MKIKLLLFVLLTGYTCVAQFPSYYIEIFFGDVQVIKPGKKAAPVNSRMLLYPEDILLIKKDGGSATLVNKDNQYTEIRKKGSFKVGDISKLPVSKPNSLMQKYFEMIWEELLDPATTSRKEKMKNIAGSIGGVIDRGICTKHENPLENTSSADNWITFSWSSMYKTTQYRFFLYNENDILLYQFKISDTAFTIGSKNFVQKGATTYYWQVESEEMPDNKTCKRKLNWMTPEEYTSKTQEIINSISNTNNHYYFLDISNKLMENGFYQLASEYFEKALEN